MSSPSWFSSLFRRHGNLAARYSRTRLAVEILEGRVVPSSLIRPIRYDMPNGGSPPNPPYPPGEYRRYWDKNYWGTGQTAVDYAPLAGGMGDLTNGVITNLNWNQAENEAGTGPYVGWRRTHHIDPVITFYFDRPFRFDRLRIHTDDANGRGGVAPPGAVILQDANRIAGYTIENPSTPDPFWIDIDIATKGIRGYSVTLQLQHGGGWVMIDEVEFYGTAITELPSTFAVGVFDPGAARWHLRTRLAAGEPDIIPFSFGAPGWLPVTGDWNGDEKTTVGVVDPTTQTWYLRNSNSPGAADVAPFRFGAPGWKPVAGDWDGNGTSTIGVFDDSTGRWYLKNSNLPGAPDIAPFAFGGAGWTPIVGDWDGDGKATIGVVDPTGRWYLRNSNSAGAPDITSFAYGGTSWKPVAGDWNGDAKTTVGTFDPGGRWFLRNATASGAPDIAPFAYGAGAWTPVVGDWIPAPDTTTPAASADASDNVGAARESPGVVDAGLATLLAGEALGMDNDENALLSAKARPFGIAAAPAGTAVEQSVPRQGRGEAPAPSGPLGLVRSRLVLDLDDWFARATW